MLTPSTPQRAGRNTLGFPRLSFYLLPHQQGTVWALGGAGRENSAAFASRSKLVQSPGHSPCCGLSHADVILSLLVCLCSSHGEMWVGGSGKCWRSGFTPLSILNNRKPKLS